MTDQASYNSRYTNAYGTMNERGKTKLIQELREKETELKCLNMKLRAKLAIAIEALEYMQATYNNSMQNVSQLSNKEREALYMQHRDPWWIVVAKALEKIKK